jgi:hypothetical protein
LVPVVQTAIPKTDREQAEEGEHAAGERVEEELDRRLRARSSPQMPIRKNSGTSVNSKNT